MPTLEDGGHLLTQSLAIIEYLEETHPTPPLLPGDALGRARVRSLSLLIACEIHPVNNLRVLQHLKRALGQNEDAGQRLVPALDRRRPGETGGATWRHGGTGQILPRRCADHGRLLPGAAGLQCAALQVRHRTRIRR